MTADVTILLTLKGRPMHTLRWMWHHDRIRLPFKLIIADGGEDPIIETYIGQENHFPNLDYTYYRYHDTTLSDYWFKLSDVIKKVKTKYVMISDNDDFVVPSAAIKYRNFLEENPDFISAGGNIAGFFIHCTDKNLDLISGNPYFLGLLSNPQQFSHNSAKDRLLTPYGGSITPYYNIIRTDIFSKIFDGFRALDLKNLDVAEHYCDSMLIALGRIKFFPDVSYVRQLGTSYAYASMGPIFKRILRNEWAVEVGRCARFCGDATYPDDPEAAAEAADIVVQHFYDHFRTRLSADAAMATPPPDNILLRLRSAAKNIPALCQLRFRKKLDLVLKRMRAQGLEAGDEKAFIADISQIGESLAGKGFPAYIQEMRANGILP